MCFPPRLFFPAVLLAGFLAAPLLRADKGDVENSHDYAGFARMPGFLITDFSEDNPAEAMVLVSRPEPIDSDHVEVVHLKGHRYVIRYELAAGQNPPSLLAVQQYYEKLAATAGYTAEKTGAVGDVTETFHFTKGPREAWVYLEPSSNVHVLTIVETKGGTAVVPVVATTETVIPAPPLVAPPPAPALSVAVAETPAPIPTPSPTPAPAPDAAPVAPTAPTPAPEVPSPAVEPTPPPSGPEDAFYTALMKKGRVILPLTFTPAKPELNDDAQPIIDRVVAIMQRHPDLQLTIEGHTDNSGEPLYNEIISKQRAMAVRTKIIEGDISKSRLTAVGLGGAHPIAENNRQGREKNRRIELVVRNDAPDKGSSPKSSAKTAKKSTAKNDAAAADDTFHDAAPNGVNYYPSTGNSNPSTTSR